MEYKATAKSSLITDKQTLNSHGTVRCYLILTEIGENSKLYAYTE
jgi:hypothetical protein